MAVKVKLEFTNEYNVFIIQVLAPSNQIDRISTYIKGKQLQDEIDRIHGAYNDVVLSFNISTLDASDFNGKNTLDVLNERIKALIEIDFTRKREINALDTQFEALKEHVEGSLADFECRYETLLKIKCLDKFDAMEKRIIQVVDADLKILRGDINEPISDL